MFAYYLIARANKVIIYPNIFPLPQLQLNRDRLLTHSQ